MPRFGIVQMVITLALAPLVLTHFRRRGQEDGARAVLLINAAVLCGPFAQAGVLP